MATNREHQIAQQMVDELEQAGFNRNQMIEVLQRAKRKLLILKLNQTQTMN